jgi:hypothetical protein
MMGEQFANNGFKTNKQSVNFAPSKHTTKKFQHIMINNNNNNNTNLALTPSFDNEAILEKLKRFCQLTLMTSG